MAHPRSRGENSAQVAHVAVLAGSSPLTRGKLGELVHFLRGHRLIPAHAGKTLTSAECYTQPWAHPRSRGENSQAEEMMRPRTGSSPLTRGKLIRLQLPDTFTGLIPAHAGKTDEAGKPVAADEAHPRSRGENDRVEDATSLKLGSSPLTRGKRASGVVAAPGRGLIPAHAGKTHVRP